MEVFNINLGYGPFRVLLVIEKWLWSIINECIGDDTKAAARQSRNCIKNKQKIKIWRKTIFNVADGILTTCNVA